MSLGRKSGVAAVESPIKAVLIWRKDFQPELSASCAQGFSLSKKIAVESFWTNSAVSGSGVDPFQCQQRSRIPRIGLATKASGKRVGERGERNKKPQIFYDLPIFPCILCVIHIYIYIIYIYYTNVYTHLSIYLSIYLCIYLSIYLYVCMYVCMYVYMYA